MTYFEIMDIMLTKKSTNGCPKEYLSYVLFKDEIKFYSPKNTTVSPPPPFYFKSPLGVHPWTI